MCSVSRSRGYPASLAEGHGHGHGQVQVRGPIRIRHSDEAQRRARRRKASARAAVESLALHLPTKDPRWKPLGLLMLNRGGPSGLRPLRAAPAERQAASKRNRQLFLGSVGFDPGGTVQFLARWLPRPYPQPPQNAQNAQNAAAPLDPAQWEEDQPGLAKPPAAPAALPAAGQQAAGLRQRSTSAPPPISRHARDAAPVAPRPLPRPRTRLCARTASWLRAGAGLLACALLYSASRQLSSREVSKSSAGPIFPEGVNRSWGDAQADLVCAPTHPLTPSKGTTRVEADVLEGEPSTAPAPPAAPAPAPGATVAATATALEASTSEATEGITPRSPVAQPAQRPLAASVGGTTSSNPLAPQTLSEAIEKILLESDPRTKLSTLATQLAEGRKGTLPVVIVDRMVDAYRASRVWREPDPMRNFLSAMILALNKGGMNIEHLEHLLHVWSWRYGELHDQAGKEIDLKKHVHPSWIADALILVLGGPSISDSCLRLLMASVAKEPDNIRPGGLNSGPGSDWILSAHARRVSHAISELMSHSTEQVSGASAGKYTIGPTQLVRCVRIFLQQPAGDRRWHPLVLTHLEKEAPQSKKREMMPTPEWKRLILQAIQEHLAETAPDLRPAHTFGEALEAFVDPEKFKAGHTFKLKTIPL